MVSKKWWQLLEKYFRTTSAQWALTFCSLWKCGELTFFCKGLTQVLAKGTISYPFNLFCCPSLSPFKSLAIVLYFLKILLVLVSYFVSVTTRPDKNNVEEEKSIWAHSFRDLSLIDSLLHGSGPEVMQNLMAEGSGEWRKGFRTLHQESDRLLHLRGTQYIPNDTTSVTYLSQLHSTCPQLPTG